MFALWPGEKLNFSNFKIQRLVSRDNARLRKPATSQTQTLCTICRPTMRVTTILLLTIIHFSTSGQRLTGKYKAYYGHGLELRDDSTFRYEWKFDLASSWAVGQWTTSKKTVILNFTNIYDTLTRENQTDSLVLSVDDRPNRITNDEFVMSLISSRTQRHDGITNKLSIKGKRLYLMDNSDRVLRTRERGIWTKRKRPTYYFRVD
jgi:hypothetical protein